VLIVVSMLLVIIGAVTLVIGVFFGDESNLALVYVSIGACLLAGLFLIAGILRNRPSRKPVLGSDGADATWSGATAWPGSEPEGAGRGAASARVLEREDETAPVGGTHVEIVTAEEPADEVAGQPVEEAPAEAAVEPAPAPSAEVEAEPTTEELAEKTDEDEVVVVPKRTAASGAKTTAKKTTAKKTAKKTAGKTTAKKAAAKKTAAKKTTAKKTAAKKTTAKKTAAKKTTAKKTAAKKTTAKKTAKKSSPRKQA
jgi:ribonuclease E